MKTYTPVRPLSPVYRRLATSIGLTGLLAGLCACGGGGGGTSPTPADFDSEVYSHKFWSQLSPEQESSKQYNGTSGVYTEVVDTREYSCTNDEYSMTETPRDFVAIDPDLSIMWLGNLIQGDSHLQVGALAELAIRERAPMNISINLLRADNARRVEQPSLTTVNAAIGELIERAVAAGHEASTNVYFESREAHSTVQTALDLGFSAEYLGSSAEASLEVDKRGEENTFFAYFIQNAFTVSMELPTAPHDMVNSDFSQLRLDELKARDAIGADNPPLYISSISYGRVLIYKMTSSHSRERMEAAISASYHGLTGGASGYTEVELQETLSTAKIEISAFGGNQASIEALIRSGRLADYFTGDTKLTSMQPISFEVRNLQDNTLANITRTTDYNVRQCMFVGRTTPPIGEKVKVIFDSAYIAHDCDGGIDKGDIYGRFDVISYDPVSQGRYTRRAYEISRSNTVDIQSGNTLRIAKSIEIDQYYGKPFEISAQLMDADGGSRGSDDIVGNWNANQFSIAGKSPGSYTKRAVSNCSDRNPTLNYRIERVSFIY